MKRRIAGFLAAALLLGAGLAAAQTTGAIEGLVLDPSRASVEACPLSIVETSTNVSRRVETDGTGRYRVVGLAPGFYRLEAACAGFKKAVNARIGVSAGLTAAVDFELEIGALIDEVTIDEPRSGVQLSSSDWGDTITQDQLESLPLNGRDMFDLADQTPGVNFATNHDSFISNGIGAQVSVNGNRPNQNSFRMDGIYMNDAAATAPASAAGRLLGIESIAELRLITNPFSAEYGKVAGGIFTAVSRSGGNDYHGSLYYFLRNSSLDARNYFDAPEQPIPALRRNQFGGLLSGPVMKNKLFFLVNYEGIRENRTTTQRAVTISDAARQGVLPSGNVTVAPVVQPFLALYPRPNGVDFGDGTGEYFSEAAQVTDESYVAAKTDFIPSARIRTAVRLTTDGADRTLPDEFQLWTIRDDSRFTFVSSETQFVQSANTLHSLRFGYSRVRNFEGGDPPAGGALSFVEGQPLGRIQVTGLTDISSAVLAARPRVHLLQDYQTNYDVSVLRGRHAIRAGAGYSRVLFNQQGDFGATGRYQFGSLSTLLQAQPRRGDLMTPDSDTKRRWSQHLYHFFLQDEVRLSRTLNVTLGVRYEGYSTPTEADGKVATLPDPLHDTDMTVGGPLFDNPSATNFAPRAALAWQPFGSGRTVIRAGAGMFFDLLSTRETTLAGMRVPPFFNRVLINNPSFPDLAAAAAAASPDKTLDGLGYNLNQPYVLQFRLALQHELNDATTMEVAYAGSRGVHLIGQFIDINVAQPQILADGTLYFEAGAPKRNPAFGRIGLRTTDFDSNYHALQLRLQRSLARGVRIQGNYTWSKSIDVSSTATVTDFIQSDRNPHPLDLHNQRGSSDFDVRHAFTMNASWLTSGPGEGLAGALLGGWELHGLMKLQTGFPFSPFTGFDRTRIQSDFSDLDQRPSLAAGSGSAEDIVLGDPNRYFNPLAFELPEPGYYGNLGRNVLTGPGLFTVNLGVQKSLWRSERQDVRLRAEFFNLTNQPNFSLPSALTLFTSNGSRVGSAGRITSTSTTSRQVQLALRWNF